MTEAEREKISSYEEAFEKIKEETGVNSMNARKALIQLQLYFIAFRLIVNTIPKIGSC